MWLLRKALWWQEQRAFPGDLPHPDPCRPHTVCPGEEGPRGGLVRFVYTEELSCPVFAPLFAPELECISRSRVLLGTSACSPQHTCDIPGQGPSESWVSEKALHGSRHSGTWPFAARSPFSSKWAKRKGSQVTHIFSK